MVKTSLAIALVSGGALSSAAFAQNQDVDYIPALQIKSVNGKPYVANPFIERANGVVLNTSAGRCVTLAMPTNDVLEDLNFAPNAGPWAGKRNNLQTLATTRSFLSVQAGVTNYEWDVITFYWRGVDSSLVTNVQENAELLDGFRVNFLPFADASETVQSGVYGPATDVDLGTFMATGGVWLPTDGNGTAAQDIYIEQINVDGGTNTISARNAPWSIPVGRRTTNTGPGDSDPTLFLDLQGVAGVFEGAATAHTLVGTTAAPLRPVNATSLVFTPTSGPTTDFVRYTTTATQGTCGAGLQTYFPAIITGELGAVVPTAATTTTLTDAGATINGTVAAGGVTWHKIIINGDARDFARQFLDITANETAGDISMALYAENGRLAGVANGSTAGNSAISENTAPSKDQLSYGIGRRSAPANGVQYFGQTGELFAGTYYLAVGARGEAFYATDFGVTVFGTGTASYSIRLDTNVNGTPLDAPVEPALIQDLGVLASGTTTATSGTVLPGNEGWYKFQLAADVAACSGGPEFLDIDFGGTSPGTADPVAFIFDASGLALYQSDDRGLLATSPGAFFPAFTFGAAGTRTYGGVNPFDGTYGGSAFTLLRGTYYLGIGHFPSAVAVRFGDRFHIRWGGDAAGAQFDVAPVFGTNAVQPQANCLVDIDTDGDAATGFIPDCGVDINDLLAFLGGFEAGDLRIDLDDDGDPTASTPDGGVDINDLLFFLSRFEGGC